MHWCASVGECRYLLRTEEGVSALELELKVVVSHPMWMLGMHLKSSERAVVF